MIPSRWFWLKSGAIILFLCASVVRPDAQVNSAKHHGEQTSFSVEFDFKHPVHLDEAAKGALATSPSLADEVKRKHLEPKDLPDHWFTASRVQLGEGVEGLVVMGPVVNTAPFWVLRQTAKGYDLVLDATTSNLEFLDTRTNGLRDIKMGEPVGVAYWATQEFQFDGHIYRIAKRENGSIDAETPRDLSGYETHAPFVQQNDDHTSPVLAEARTWIWQRWKSHKRFYVAVVKQNDDGTQATYQLYTSNDSDQTDLVLKIHKTEWEQDSTSEPRRKVVEDDLWTVPDLKRVYPAVDEDHSPQVIPDGADVAASVYRLGFLEGIHWLATM